MCSEFLEFLEIKGKIIQKTFKNHVFFEYFSIKLIRTLRKSECKPIGANFRLENYRQNSKFWWEGTGKTSRENQ